MHPYLTELLALELTPCDYVLFGSGPLLARGWIEDVGDLDVLARGRAWERARALGEVEHLAEWNVSVVNIGDVITVGQRWAIGDPDVDELIETADLISGIPCARLEAVVAYKQISDRPKDRAHIQIIESRLS